MIIITIVLVLLDIISKLLIKNYLELYQSIKVINNFLNITYVRNTGAAWSLFNDMSFMVLGISMIIILGIILYIYKHRPYNINEKISYSLILGGAIGNFIDRVLYGYVVDFIDIKIFSYDYPIFNLADVFIVLGVIILMIDIWRGLYGDKGNR